LPEGSKNPLFGRTQYLLGAVVLTLKQTRLSDGFFSFSWDVTTSLNGPTLQYTVHLEICFTNIEKNSVGKILQSVK